MKITKEFLDGLNINNYVGFSIDKFIDHKTDFLSEKECFDIINLAKKGLEVEAMEKKLEKAVKALGFYACEASWRDHDVCCGSLPTIATEDCTHDALNVGGKLARETIEEIKGMR